MFHWQTSLRLLAVTAVTLISLFVGVAGNTVASSSSAAPVACTGMNLPPCTGMTGL